MKSLKSLNLRLYTVYHILYMVHYLTCNIDYVINLKCCQEQYLSKLFPAQSSYDYLFLLFAAVFCLLCCDDACCCYFPKRMEIKIQTRIEATLDGFKDFD